MEYVDISGMSGLTFSQNLTYRTAWNTFNRVQTFDSNVSTQIKSGVSGLQYYNFSNYIEKAQFTQGQYLHLQAYPYYSTLWYTVQKNYK